MSRRPYTGGAESRRRRGLKAVLVPVPPDLHTAMIRAAAACDPPQRVTVWAAHALERAAREALAGAGADWPGPPPEENSENSAPQA
jgi:hypothetical protein